MTKSDKENLKIAQWGANKKKYLRLVILSSIFFPFAMYQGFEGLDPTHRVILAIAIFILFIIIGATNYYLAEKKYKKYLAEKNGTS